MKTVLPTVALAALLCAAPNVAHAEDEDAEVTRMAKEHYKAGLDAYKSAKYDVAIKELKKAYLLKRLPALLLNIGATYRKMGDLDLALHFYKKYLDEAPAEARDRGEVEKTIAEIQQEKEGGGVVAPGDTEAAPKATAKEPGGSPPPVKHEEEAPPPPRPAPMPQEWSHTVVDAAPPETPLDVRVSTPVMKGVKVYVYYRGAGEENFNAVLMKRRGAEKVGRIPAKAIQGKAIQYYIEARDPAGTVVKSSGSQSSPNIVMVDPSAPPQMLASAEERRNQESQEPADEEPRGKKKEQRNLDEESAPVTGSLDEEKPRDQQTKKHKVSSGAPGKYGKLFWAGVGVAAGGALLLGGGIALSALAGQKSNQISVDSMNPVDNNMNKIFFNNDPNAPSGQQEADVQKQGQLFNTIGIAGMVVGSVGLVAGAALMLTDQVFLKMAHAEKPRKHRRRPRPVEQEEESSAKPWYVAPAGSPTYVGLGGGFSF